MEYANDERHVYRLAIVIIFGIIMSILDATIVNVALNTLHHDLHATLAQVQWVATGYMLALASVIPVSGWMARRFGDRRIYITSLILFTCGSILCGAAWSISSLIAFRVLQGLGGGMLMPVGQMILARAAGPHRMGRVMSVVGVPMLLAPIFGPVIGGVLVQHASWRWIFYVNVPIGIIAITLAFLLLHPHPTEDAGRLNFTELALLSIGVPSLVYGIAEYGEHGALVGRSWITLLVGVGAIATFIWHALRSKYPLLDVRLFRKPAFTAATVTAFCVGGALFGSMILLPLFFQTVRLQGATMAGVWLIPQGLGAALAMPIAGKLTDKIGGGILAVFGVCIVLAGTIPLVFIGAYTPYWVIAATLAMRGVGLGFTMMPVMATAYALLRPEEIADATPQLSVIQQIGGSVGTATLAVILSRSLTTRLAHAAPHADRLALMAGGYQHAYTFAVFGIGFAILPALALWVLERRVRRKAGNPATNTS